MTAISGPETVGAATCESCRWGVRERQRPALLWTGREVAGLSERGCVTRTKDVSNQERDRRICLLRRNGFTYSEIAQMEGLSRVRVGQIVKEANAELPEDDTRAEIATLFEFAERKIVELINDPGYMLGPNGRLATDDDGNPVVNKQLINEGIKTLVVIGEKKSKLFGTDKGNTRTLMLTTEADQQRIADIQRRQAEFEELARRAGQQAIPGEIVRELPAAGA